MGSINCSSAASQMREGSNPCSKWGGTSKLEDDEEVDACTELAVGLYPSPELLVGYFDDPVDVRFLVLLLNIPRALKRLR